MGVSIKEMKRATRTIAKIFSKRRKRDFDFFIDGVPEVIDDCITHLLVHGLKVEGIFRSSGEFRQVADILRDAGKGKRVSWSITSDPHLVACVIKVWLCELENPLLTWELHDCFIAAQDGPSVEESLRRIATVIQILPIGARAVFQRLVFLMTKIDAHSETNKMNASNLAIVFAPVLLRYEVEDLTKMLAHSEASNRVIKLCITN